MTPAWVLEAGAALPAAAAVARATFATTMESWHDFYLLTGTAAVTLAGLLFVALSLHLEQLVEESHEHLLALARAMVTAFVMVLIASLMMLAPGFSQRITGFALVAVGSIGGLVTLRMLGTVPHHDAGGFTAANMLRRKALAVLGYVLMVGTGAGIMLGNQDLLHWAVGAFCVLLANAAGTSFELLVHVARHKKRAREAQRA